MRVRPGLCLARARSIVPNASTKGPRSSFGWPPATLPARTRARSLRKFQNLPSSTQPARAERSFSAPAVRFGAVPQLLLSRRVDPQHNEEGKPRLLARLAKSQRTFEIAGRPTRNLAPPPLVGQARTKPSCRWDPALAPGADRVLSTHARSVRSARSEPVATGSTNRRQRAKS